VSEQGRLFDPDRYSPATIAAYLRLPESGARAFAIASALGSWVRADGGRERVRSGREVAGAVVTRRRLALILRLLAITDRAWRYYVTDWASRYVAHRCSTGTVCLFTRPLLDECPACHAWIDVVDEAPPAKSQRGQSGSTASAQTEVQLPRDGRTTSAASEGQLPAPGTNTTQPISLLSTRGEVDGSDHDPDSLPARAQRAPKTRSRTNDGKPIADAITARQQALERLTEDEDRRRRNAR
jgi:hypothetical protein